MGSLQFRTTMISAVMLGSFAAVPAMAERALIIANHQYVDAEAQPALRKDAADVSQTFLGLGYAANRIENPSQDRLASALDALSETDGPIVIYYAGETIVEDGKTQLLLTDGTKVGLAESLERADSGSETIIFLDICRTAAEVPTDGVESESSDDTPDEIVSFRGLGDIPQDQQLFIASTAAPATACPDQAVALSDTLIERLQLTGVPLDTLFADTGVTTASTITQPFFFREVATGAQLTAEDYDYLDTLSPAAQEQIIASWTASGIAVDRVIASAEAQPTTPTRPSGTVVLTSPVKPVSGGATLAPITRQVARVSAGARAPVVAAAPAPTPTGGATSRPVPGTGGLPQPSIIVGLLEPTQASFNTATAPTGPVAGAAVEYSDIETRRALRDRDPETFATLISSGAFDPPEEELVVALQTELQRMNCYTAGIDGQWGPGSRRSVANYYEQIGGAAPSQEPAIEIFRQILERDDVECPAVAAAPRPAPQAAATRSQPRQQQPAARQQPAQPQQPQQQPSRTINRSTGTGIFR